ncbi:MAG: DUF1343 domain-containing protein [Sedimentisphaerales bacterium]|nr:DUF1343 domain-containing protein [Sedimentisphaerales bacterium]
MRTVNTFIKIIVIIMLGGCRNRVETGLDRISTCQHLFRGKRIGIITNHTAYNRRNQFIVDILRNIPDVTIVALFSPEHGFFGREQAAVRVPHQTDPTYNLPVHSLYGATRKPNRNMLKGIDLLVFDIQDIGVRFYTYIYTMALAMEAAAEERIQFIVLDRPNPLGGLRVGGNVLDRRWASFVGMYPVAVRHGMTVGELATMFNEEGWLANGVRADLKVITMKGWQRQQWYDQTKLTFIKPSPNIPNLETAILYPGLCLLEGTNLSEGRGTDLPFRQFGAPWIDAKQLTARLNELRLPGLRFEPVTFVPVSSKYKNQKCRGVKVLLTQRNRLEAFWSGVRIINEIYRMYPRQLEWKTDHFDHLCGTSTVRKAIIHQSSLESLRTIWQTELESFRRIRKKYLLYPLFMDNIGDADE